MKKLLILSVGVVCFSTLVMGGGIVTNTNQSASYIRMLARDASTEIDAVYFNPAGLFKLDNGFHFSINSQSIFQNKDVIDSYANLVPAPKKFLGNVKAPVFPGVYAAWKTGNLAISFGFNPVGGGGGATYEKGLPSFETRLSDLVPILQGQLAMIDALLSLPAAYGFDPMFRNVTSYSADIYFKGTSVFFGYQGGLTYKINQFLGVYGGVRLVTAKNTYKGHIRDMLISASPTDPPLPLYDVPAGDYTPAGNYLRAIAGATGLPGSVVNLLNNLADTLDIQTSTEADAEEKGNGYTPILGVNISIGDRVNIGLKYEFKTKLELKQTVHDGKDAYGMFVQDSTIHSDMPAMLSVGVGVKILPDLRAMAGLHYYFDKDANFGKTLYGTGEPVKNDKVIDKNTFEIAVGLEYNITPKLLVSGGYLLAKSGVNEDYQSDISFDLSSNSGAIGLGYNLTSNIKLNFGFTYVKYIDGKKDYTHIMEGTGYEVPATQTYISDAKIFAIGADFNF